MASTAPCQPSTTPLPKCYATDDITIVGICYERTARIRSHELIAHAVNN